jgi:hypothetical protein
MTISSRELSQIATAIRSAVINEGPWLLRRPGHALWALLVHPTSGAAILNLPGVLAYLAIRHEHLLPKDALIPFQRLVTFVALELPLLGDQGKRLHTIALRNGSVDVLYPNCCLLRTQSLPWLYNEALPALENGQDATQDSWTVPDLNNNDLQLQFGVASWPPPDLGGQPFANSVDFYRTLNLPDPASLPKERHHLAYQGLMLRYRSFERTRCQLLGYPIPAWLINDDAIESECIQVVENLRRS